MPLAWMTCGSRLQSVPLDPAKEASARATAAKAIAKYPRSILVSNLRRIVLLSYLEFDGESMGGLSFYDSIYIVDPGRDSAADHLQFVERAIHHEVAHILAVNYRNRFESASWMARNPPGFAYQGDGHLALHTGRASTDYDEALLAQGFLTEYSTSSLEEDFCMIAEGLFAGGRVFWEAVDRNPRTLEKVWLAIKFYRRLSPEFGESTFRAYADSP